MNEQEYDAKVRQYQDRFNKNRPKLRVSKIIMGFWENGEPEELYVKRYDRKRRWRCVKK